MTVVEATAMLSIVNAAISELVQGKRKRSLKIGTHEFMRAREYSEISYAELVAERDRLQNFIDANSTAPVTPTFRKNTSFPMLVTKHPV